MKKINIFEFLHIIYATAIVLYVLLIRHCARTGGFEPTLDRAFAVKDLITYKTGLTYKQLIVSQSMIKAAMEAA